MMFIGDCNGNVVSTVLLALLGIGVVFLVSKVFDNLPKCFTYLNIGAITVLGVHGTFISIIKSHVDDIILELPIYPSLFWAISSIVILLLFIPINWLLDKYLPIVLGNRH